MHAKPLYKTKELSIQKRRGSSPSQAWQWVQKNT